MKIYDFIDIDRPKSCKLIALFGSCLISHVLQYSLFPFLLLNELFSQLFTARAAKLHVYEAGTEKSYVQSVLDNVLSDYPLTAITLYRRPDVAHEYHLPVKI